MILGPCRVAEGCRDSTRCAVEVVAWDLETELITDRHKIRSRSGEELNVSLMVWPRVVLGSAAWGDEVHIFTPEEMAARLRGWLVDGVELVGHNCVGFDIPVICAAFPDLREPFFRAAETGQLHETLFLDLLVGLAEGRFDRPVFDAATKTWAVPDPRYRSLDVLAKEYAGLMLDKDPAVRLTYAQFKDRPLAELPAAHRRYAEDDARATLAVYQALQRRVAAVRGKNNLSEALQIRAALALADLDTRGVHVDRALAGRLAASFEEQIGPLKGRLVAAGLGRWAPRPKTRGKLPALDHQAHDWIMFAGKLMRTVVPKTRPAYVETAEADFHLNTSALQQALADLAVEGAPRRTDGSVSCDAEFWGEWVPPDSPLQDWLLFMKVQKILTTYLATYQQTDVVFPRWNVLGARSGRMSAAKPSLQNVSKRKAGIRAIFVPSPGKVFVVADYTAQELFTLGEVMLDMGLIGPLYQTLTSGVDIHRYGAALVLGKDIKDVTKEERQAAKACHFGVPGGLGAKKLAAYAHNYGVRWTVEEAAERRQRFLDTFTDIAAYLRRLKTSQDDALRAATGEGKDYWAARLGVSGWNVIKALSCAVDPTLAAAGYEAERQLCVELRSGRQRGHCRFTEGANTYFQGTAADVTKAAVWRFFRRGGELVMVVHDELVAECDSRFQDAVAEQLRDCMLEAFCEVCPRMGPFAGVEVKTGLTRWGPATDLLGKEMRLEFG